MARRTVAERREQLIRSALAVMSEEGLDAATTRRIAEHAGVQLAIVHYAFDTKQTLLTAVVERVTDDVAATVSTAIEGSTSLRAAVEDSIAGFWSMVEESPGLQVMQYELTTYALRRPELAWLAQWQYERYCEAVEVAYRRVLGDGERTAVPLPQLVRLVVAGVDGIILQFVVHRSVRRARQDLRNLIGVLGTLVEER